MDLFISNNFFKKILVGSVVIVGIFYFNLSQAQILTSPEASLFPAVLNVSVANHIDFNDGRVFIKSPAFKTESCKSSDKLIFICNLEVELTEGKKYSVWASVSNSVWKLKYIKVLRGDVEWQRKECDQNQDTCILNTGENTEEIVSTKVYNIEAAVEFFPLSPASGPFVPKLEVPKVSTKPGSKIAPSKFDLGIGGIFGGVVGAPIGGEKVVPAGRKPSMPSCGDGVCSVDVRETCSSCSEDCGACTYGKAGNNNASVCGWYEKAIKPLSGIRIGEKRHIKKKPGNLDIGNSDVMKEAIRTLIYINPQLYFEVKNGIYDNAVRKIGNYINGLYYKNGYTRTPCYKRNEAPTSVTKILTGGSGNCVDWAALALSMLRTMDVPRDRISMVCYPVRGVGSSEHCVANYKSDSGDQWVIDYGRIVKKLSQLGALRCRRGTHGYWATSYSYWANDNEYGWGMNGLTCD